MIISLLPWYVPLDPGNPVDLFPGGGAMVVLIVIGIIAAVAVGIWRMTLVNTASKQLGLTDEQRLLAVTDEHGGAAVVAGAAIAGKSENDSEPADLPTRLAALQSALDQGLITPEEFASTRQRILDGA